MEDGRVFARMKARFPLGFLNPETGQEGQAQTFDISANGLGLVCNDDLTPNTPLEIWMRIPDQHEPLYLRGIVIWSNPLSGVANQRRLGVRLEKAELMGLARVLWFKKREQG